MVSRSRKREGESDSPSEEYVKGTGPEGARRVSQRSLIDSGKESANSPSVGEYAMQCR